MKLRLIKKSTKLVKKGLSCLNCGHPFRGDENFCPYCGQKNNTNHLSFGLFLNNFFSGMFNYDSRFWKTFVPLLTMPGKVSRLYIDGKRVCFVNPFQLYLNVSIIFFLLLGFVEKFSDEEPAMSGIVNITNTADSIQKNPAQLDSIAKMAKAAVVANERDSIAAAQLNEQINEGLELAKVGIEKNNKPYEYHIATKKESQINFFNRMDDFQNYSKEHGELKTDEALTNLGYSKGLMNVFWYKNIRNANNNLQDLKKEEGIKDFLNRMISYVPISLFIFLPIFTLFLSLIYIRRRFTYMEHLVFVFHTQTVFFLLYIIYNVINLFVNIESASWVFLIMFLIYLYKALRAFYLQGRFKTFTKFMILNSYYMFLATIGIVIISVLTMVEG